MIERLRTVPLLQPCSGAFLERVASFTSRIVLAAQTGVFKEGDCGESLYIVQSGTVEIRKGGNVLAILEAGSLFGEMALFEDEPRSADAVTRTASALLEINISRFRDLLRSYPDEGVRILFSSIQEMSRRLRATSQHLVTVFETGRMVGARAPLEQICRNIVLRLMHDVPSAAGGMVLLANPYTCSLDETCRIAMTVAEAGVVRGAAQNNGETAMIQLLENGTMLMTPLRDDEHILGYLVVRKEGIQTFSLDEEILVSTVADQVGLGLITTYQRQDEDARRRLEWNRMHHRSLQADTPTPL